jgi:hypothetical protein
MSMKYIISETQYIRLINENDSKSFIRRRFNLIKDSLNDSLERVDPIENGYTSFDEYKDEVIWQTFDDIKEGNDVDLNADLYFEIVTTVFLDKIKDRWNEWEKLIDY